MARVKSRDLKRQAEWRRIVVRQKRSGLSIRAFCRQNHLAESTFYFWRRELQCRQAAHVSDVALAKPRGQRSGHRTEQRHRQYRHAAQRHDETTPGPAGPTFVPVHVTEDLSAGRIEIELSGGYRVQVAGAVERTVLADVLAILEGMACPALPREAGPC